MREQEEEAVAVLGRGGVAWRLVALIAGVVLICYGSVFGNDVQWPFAPMSQFAFRVGHNDEIHSTFLEGATADGVVERVPISPGSVGMKRADVEGIQPAMIRQPSLLGTLAANYHRLHPGAAQLTQLWLQDEITQLRDGRDAGRRIVTLVSWRAP